MNCFNPMVCSLCITHWREGLHWYYNICRTFHHEWRNLLRDLYRYLWYILGLLIMVSSPPTTHMPVLRDCEIIGAWAFVLPILRGVGRWDIWIEIQNWNSAAGISKNHIMWYLEEEDSVCWGDIICVESYGCPFDSLCKFVGSIVFSPEVTKHLFCFLVVFYQGGNFPCYSIPSI